MSLRYDFITHITKLNAQSFMLLFDFQKTILCQRPFYRLGKRKASLLPPNITIGTLYNAKYIYHGL